MIQLVSSSDVVVEVRDSDLNRVGQIQAKDMQFTAISVFNGVGEWTLQIPAEHDAASQLKRPGWGISVLYMDRVFLTGPMTEWEQVESAESPKGDVIIKGVSDDCLLWDRVVYPDPSNENINNRSVSHDVRKGVVEDLLYDYTARNLGQLAVESRRAHNVFINPDRSGHRGHYIAKQSRFEVLGDMMRSMCRIDRLGFYMTQYNIMGSERIGLMTYQTADRRNEIRLSVDSRTLESSQIARTAPEVTHVIAAGKGQKTGRMLALVSTPDSENSEFAWKRRREEFLDQRQTDSVDELHDAAAERLTAGGTSFLRLKATPSDDTVMNFNKTWFLGDRVTVIIDNEEFNDIVTGVGLSVTPSGVHMGVKIGLEEERTLERPLDHVLDRRISNLEREAEVNVTDSTVVSKSEYSAGKWLRIAYCPGSKNWAPNVASEFTVTCSNPGRHDYLKFNAAVTDLDANISLVTYAAYNDNPSFTSLRFVRDPNDPIYGDGYLEIYVADDLAEVGDIQVDMHSVPSPHIRRWKVVTPKVSTVTSGSSWVESQVGLHVTRPRDIVLRSGWRTVDGYQPPQFHMSSNSVVTLSGGVDGSSAWVEILGNLPSGCRPKMALQVGIAGFNGNTYRVTIRPDGDIAFWGNPPFDPFIPLTGISFSAEH